MVESIRELEEMET